MRAAALLLALGTLAYAADRTYDQVDDLPGVTFDVRFRHYSGYLDASLGNHLHYWFFESQSNPTQSPLVLWLNGGPGCSSMGGLMTENGPFHPTQDGKHLQENVFAWNKIANILYIDSPRDVGYSYRDNSQPPDNVYNNSKTADDLVLALKSFVSAYQEYNGRDLFVTGESYSGVYIPQLVNALIQQKDFPLVLKGFAVGNGLLSKYDSFNADIDLLYYRGHIGKHEFDSLYDCCQLLDPSSDLLYCDFSKFINVDDNGDVNANKYDDQNLQQCADYIARLGDYAWTSKNDVYNTYQDCYDSSSAKSKKSMRSKSVKSYSNNESPLDDQGKYQSASSTDALGGFQCYMDDATENYMNLPEVRKALHIREDTQRWVDCADIPYVRNEHDMSDVFDAIVDSGVALRGLIYNGDLDMADSFLADEWFIARLAERKNLAEVAQRRAWEYTREAKMQRVDGGFAMKYKKGDFSIDLVTVKGSGHFVPLDRAGPALQMISNFLSDQDNYSHMSAIPLTPANLLPEFQSPPEPALSRKEADRIYDLPGLTFKLNFNQYAGYLNGIKGNYLHYWFVESQSKPETDPLVLWLSGGPGCSGYTALLWGNGPFRPNRDGTTVFENVYSWNKIANVIFIDSPRGVGYSFQNTTENPNTDYNDELSANDLYLAIVDFMEVFPEYKNRPFYLAGESYGGVYAPSTAGILVDKIQSGEASYIKLEGVSTANALLSSYDNFNAQIQYQYFHGAIGKDEWDSLQQCCPQSQHPADPAYFEFCDFTKFVNIGPDGTPTPKDPNDFCGQKTVNISLWSAWAGPQTQFNIYASCYELPDYGNNRPELIKPYYAKKDFVDQARLVSHEISDSQDGQFCWGQLALKQYLNSAEVQAALHVREMPNNKLVTWTGCSNIIGYKYNWQYLDMRPFYDKMIASDIPLKFLIYNGDVDQTCNFLSGQWFAERMANDYNMEATSKHAPWMYLEQIGGYAEQFKYKNVTMDVVTVKGAGHFCALDRPGPTLQVFNSFINSRPMNAKIYADLELAELEDRYNVEEEVGRQKDLNVPAASKNNRAKRAINAADPLPAPPPKCSKTDNKVSNLPGLTFDFKSNHYSGYLNAGSGDYLHYWFVEAAQDPDTAPLILWFNGGPGCSSLNGLLSELGPFLNNRDGETLYENVFSWHKIGNILFLESPRGVGFSYQASDSDPTTTHKYSDTLTAEDNVRALLDFLNCFPEYKNRKMFITGESYAGVYIPTFVDKLLKGVIDGSVPGVALEGIAIGNGVFSGIQDVNSNMVLTYFRGMHSKKEWEALAKCVPPDFTGPMTYFDWTRYVDIGPHGNPVPKSFNTSTLEGFCGTEVLRQGWLDVWLSKNDVYNTYQDCYVRHPLPSQGDQAGSSNGAASEKKRRVKRDALGRPMNYDPFIDEAKRMNYQATDNDGGVTCYDGKTPYLNIPEVRKAIHIPDYFTKEWVDCAYGLEETTYIQEYNDTTPVFESIFDSTKRLGNPFRMLLYHGDADMACQFLGGQWFIEALAARNKMEITSEFAPWVYKQTKTAVMQNIGGFLKSFSHDDASVTIDWLTVKGAGHYVPVDRPGPILQAMYNFVHNSKNTLTNPVDYNIPIYQSPLSLDRTPLKPEYLGAPDQMLSRSEADRVYDLPGLTYNLNFDQHSGYLQASKGNKLFYWYMQGQNLNEDTPLVLWLNGGPGCSSLIGLFTENGPFRVNADSKTLYENIYSWNKAAHVLYIDSPRQVGFSYQNKTENSDHLFDDDKTASDAYLALEDFFVAYPHLKKLDFYISGESYCGVYIPLITAYTVNKIKAGESSINLKGMVIGNGQVSYKQDIRTMPSFYYMHSMIGKDIYDGLSDCCVGNDTLGGLYCHYDEIINPINYEPRPGLNATEKKCVFKILEAAAGDISGGTDAYNLYQDCYANPVPSRNSDKEYSSYKSKIAAMRDRGKRVAKAFQGVEDFDSVQLTDLDPHSTDNSHGYQCYMDDATIAYLQNAHLRTALHVPSYVQAWDECRNILYKTLYEDMTEQFETVMNSGLNLRVLLYNGDIDTVCQFMQAQWFVEELAHKNNLQESDRSEWHYDGVIAGYQTKYTTDGFQLELLTVKGAGHMVPTDRPGPTLQMIGSFLRKESYDTPIPYSLERQPLLQQYTRQGVPEDDPTPEPTESPTNTDSSSSTVSDTSSSVTTTTVSDTSSSVTTTTVPTTTTTSASSIFTFLTFFVVVLVL